ncbi:alpha/beta hydrolase [Pendulispora rubella]|uniref:Alpha/beta hydrolase n=1 Tax=Pendulispora rubella TaxID=2741070 RepID=A0ABZ2LCG7_9BACT
MKFLSFGLAVALSLATGCSGGNAKPPATVLSQTGRQSVLIEGVSIVYHVHGSGPVVFAHPGGPGAEWSYLRMPEVEKVATVVYIEPMGTGASGNLSDPNGYTFARYAAFVDGVRAHLGVDRFVLLGHSHGGFVAQTYALAHPEHLRGLILYDTSPTTGTEWQKDVESNLKWFEHEPWFDEAKAGLAQETSVKTDDEMTAVFRREMPLYFADWTGRQKEYEPLRAHVRFAVAPTKSGVDPSAPADVGVTNLFDVRSRLGEIKVPTLVLVGTKDFVCSRKWSNVLHEGIKGSQLVVFEKSGHMGHIEEPRAHASAIAEFLAPLTP